MAKRKADLEAKEAATRVRKLKIAAQVKRDKLAAKQKKEMAEESYKRSVEERFHKKLADRDSQFSNNQHEIYQLEEEEKLMVEKLN